ncbi:hypothetical protein [Xanthomonas bundabergensis]|uniref:hypothetical protein n=1 Tax=Xanthomonas bundabergensis TaxID=3160842 RepID=UPI0035157573
MDAVIQYLLSAGGLKVAVPLVVMGFAVISVRGGFGLHRSYSANRKEFLDIFQEWEKRGDLWLSVSIRHCFGKYLPPCLIRRLMDSSDPASALLEVSNGWGAFVFDPNASILRWRNPRNSSSGTRKWKRRWYLLGYFGLACTAMLIAYGAVRLDLTDVQTFIAWTYAALAAFGAVFCLVEGDHLKDAGVAAERWLGMGEIASSSLFCPETRENTMRQALVDSKGENSAAIRG